VECNFCVNDKEYKSLDGGGIDKGTFDKEKYEHNYVIEV